MRNPIARPTNTQNTCDLREMEIMLNSIDDIAGSFYGPNAFLDPELASDIGHMYRYGSSVFRKI